MERATVEVGAHPRFPGDWLLKPNRGTPFGLWYRDREHAVSCAECVKRELARAEILLKITTPPKGVMFRPIELMGGMDSESSNWELH